MPSFRLARNVLEAAVSDVAEVHEDAPTEIISLSWAFLFIPCIFLVLVFLWLVYNFSQPSEFPQSNGYGHDEDGADGASHSDDEKEQLLDAFSESQSHALSRSQPSSPTSASDSTSGLGWKIQGKFSTTARGGSVYSSYPDPNGSYQQSTKSPFASSSPRSARGSPKADEKPNRAVGSKAAKILAYNREKMMHDLESLDPIDREQLTRSSSRASDTRKSD